MKNIKRDERDPVPNKFTIRMGELISQARNEAGLSQEELGKLVHRRRETISVIENGKTEVGSILLTMIAHATDKPLTFFIPEFAKIELHEEKLNDEDTELLLQFRRIWDPKNRQIALAQVRAMAKFDTEEGLKKSRKES